MADAAINPNVDQTIDFRNPNTGALLNGAIQLAAALPNINFRFLIDGPGKNLTIKGGAGYRVFNIVDKIGTIRGLTLMNGDVRGNPPGDEWGGAIRNVGKLTVKEVSIQNCKADGGGGIYSNSDLTLTKTDISNCQAVNNGGGGILSLSKLEMSECEISNNAASRSGGGLYTVSTTTTTTTIDKSTFKYNSANQSGGAIEAGSGTYTITNSTIGPLNIVTGMGAGLGVGGGIDIVLGTLNLTNSTVAYNTASRNAGGINAGTKSTVNLKSSTIAFNSANNDGGGLREFGGTVKPVNTAFVQNTAGGVGTDVFGTVASLGFNLIEWAAGSNGWIASDIKNLWFGTSFEPLAQNGGPTETCLPDSNAIDAGSNASSPGPTDQRGQGFPRILPPLPNGRIDIGAVEVKPAKPAGPANVGDYVWDDQDQDGIQDSGEPGVDSASVFLYQSDGTLVAATTTDETGHYLFDNIPTGSYYIVFAAPYGYAFTVQDAGTDDTIDSDANPATGRTATFTLTETPNLTIDAGIVKLPYGTIGDRVWDDTPNGNGIQDAGEVGLAGVVVDLYTANNEYVNTTVTDSAGHYQFDDVAPGDYYVVFNRPLNYLFSPKDAGTNNAIDSDANAAGQTDPFTLAMSQLKTDLDAGLVLQQPTGVIGNRVWWDQNQNGIQDGNEPGVGGVMVQLLDANNNVLRTTYSASDGSYSFIAVAAGTYRVKFSAPGAQFTARDVGDDNSDSDADPSTGMTDVFFLGEGETNNSIDAGLLAPLPDPILVP